MPSNRHLEFADVDDFTPGLFTAGDWLVPPTAAQTMTDCHPEVGGGLRAAAKPTSFSTTGLASSNERVIGLYARGAIALRAGIGDASDRYVWTYNTSDNKIRVYRWDETNADTSWSVIHTHAAVSATPNPVQADSFVDASGVAYVVYTIAQTGTDDGLWSIKYSDGTVTKQLGTIFPLAVAVQDDRILVGDQWNIRFSDSQSVSSFPSANELPVQASRQGNQIMSITPFAPGDLLLGTRYSPWTMIQGDITDPIVRTQSPARTIGWPQYAVFTEAGLAFIAPSQGVFLTSTGESFEDISAQLDRSIWVQGGSLLGDVGGGTLGYIGPFLLAPHGYLFDFRTKSWFRSSVLAGAKGHFHTHGDSNYRQLFAATGDVAYSLYTIDAKESARWNTYTWKSAPLRRPDGRQVEIREVQVYARSYDASATIAVTVNGTTRTVTLGAAGKHQANFLFSERDEVLDVQVVPTAAGGSVEAPSIEVVRIGSQSRHTLL